MVMFLSLELNAQDVTGHWSVNIYDFEYDMTAYVTLTHDNIPVGNLSNYEIAAFCGNECRGVAQIQNVGDSTYGYLRIHSNVAGGETITFKYYNSMTGQEGVLYKVVDFAESEVLGIPSAPLELSLSVMFGDVNGNGKMDIGDAVCIVNYLVDKESDTFIEEAADTNKNGKIDIGDAVTIVNMLVGKTPNQ